jgi:hypothetical protein
LKKVKKKRKQETEEDSDSSEKEGTLPTYSRQASAWRKYRIINPRRAPMSGGHPPPGGYILHHNFRYAPEALAYKVPKPQYSSYPRREPERTYIRQRYAEKPVDEKTLERVIRRVYKDLAENHELTPKEHPEAAPTEKISEPSDTISLGQENAIRIEQRFAKKESEHAADYVEENSQDLTEAEVDPEQLLDQLEANPTEELHAKTLAELNAEPKFYEEEIEGSKIETDRLSSVAISDLAEQSLEAPTLPGEELVVAPREEMLEATIVAPLEQTSLSVENANSVMAEPLLQVECPLTEIEVLTDVQDLMRELEPEIAEEEEEVEPSY